MEEIEITLKNLATLHSDAYHKHEDTSGFTFFHTTTLSVLRRLPEGVQFHIKLAYTKVKIDDEHDIKLIIGYLSIERMLFVAYAFSVYLTPSNLLPLLDPLMAYNTSLRSLELRTLEDEDVHRETAKKMFPSPTIYRQKIIHTSLVQEHLRWINPTYCPYVLFALLLGRHELPHNAIAGTWMWMEERYRQPDDETVNRLKKKCYDEWFDNQLSWYSDASGCYYHLSVKECRNLLIIYCGPPRWNRESQSQTRQFDPIFRQPHSFGDVINDRVKTNPYSGIRGIPTFLLDENEISKFGETISLLRPWGLQYGMLKVVPPQSWSENVLDKDFKKTFNIPPHTIDIDIFLYSKGYIKLWKNQPTLNYKAHWKKVEADDKNLRSVCPLPVLNQYQPLEANTKAVEDWLFKVIDGYYRVWEGPYQYGTLFRQEVAGWNPGRLDCEPSGWIRRNTSVTARHLAEFSGWSRELDGMVTVNYLHKSSEPIMWQVVAPPSSWRDGHLPQSSKNQSSCMYNPGTIPLNLLISQQELHQQARIPVDSIFQESKAFILTFENATFAYTCLGEGKTEELGYTHGYWDPSVESERYEGSKKRPQDSSEGDRPLGVMRDHVIDVFETAKMVGHEGLMERLPSKITLI